MVAISDKPIPQQWLDIDFGKESKRAGRLTGCNPRTDQKGDACPLFGEVFRDKVIPRSDWRSHLETLKPNYSRHDLYQMDQDGEGTCTSFAEAAAFAALWNQRYGPEWQVISSGPSTYQFCARSGNSGSTTSCILKRGRDFGRVLIDNPQNRKVLEALGLNPDHTIREVGWRQEVGHMKETMRQFRTREFYEIDGVDEFFSALLLGFPILYGRSGHAIKGTDLVLRNGVFACRYRNSWGRWGDQGYGYDSLDYIAKTNAPWGAYALQTLIVPDNDQALHGVPTLAV